MIISRNNNPTTAVPKTSSSGRTSVRSVQLTPSNSVPLAVLILGRDILLGLSALYYRYISLPPPRTFARYWDFSLPSAEVRPTSISKVNTFLQLGLIGATMSGLAMGGLGDTAQTALNISWWVVGATTVWSGGSYIWGRDAVRILNRKP